MKSSINKKYPELMQCFEYENLFIVIGTAEAYSDETYLYQDKNFGYITL